MSPRGRWSSGVETSETRQTRRRPGRPRAETPSAEYVAKRERIIAAAAAVFREKGYAESSLDDVAAALDIRKASLYHYVRSKADLLLLVFDRGLARGLDRLEAIRKIKDPAERLATLIRRQIEVVVEDIDHFAVFFDHVSRRGGASSAENAKGWSAIRARERAYLKVFIDAVASAVEAGVIAPLDPRYGALAILGMTSWLYKWFDPRRDDAGALAEACIRLVLAGRHGGRRRGRTR